jgi:hypothetical protein
MSWLDCENHLWKLNVWNLWKLIVMCNLLMYKKKIGNIKNIRIELGFHLCVILKIINDE